MFGGIKDIWILTESGITLFQKMDNEELGNQLFGMLMSALNTFATKLSKGEGITGFEISQTRFAIIKKNHLLFIAGASRKVKEKKIFKYLEYISEKFIELYPNEIEGNTLIDVDTYSDFEDRIKIT